MNPNLARPLALNDMQMRLLQRAAASLPVEQRDRFIQQVGAQLRGQPGTAAVATAIDRALATLQPIYLCDAAAERGT